MSCWVPALKAIFPSTPVTLHLCQVGGKRWRGRKKKPAKPHYVLYFKPWTRTTQRYSNIHLGGLCLACAPESLYNLKKEKPEISTHCDWLAHTLAAEFTNLILFSISRHFYPENTSDLRWCCPLSQFLTATAPSERCAVGGKHLSRSSSAGMRWWGCKWWINDQYRESQRNEGDYAGTILYEYINYLISWCFVAASKAISWSRSEYGCLEVFSKLSFRQAALLAVLKTLVVSLEADQAHKVPTGSPRFCEMLNPSVWSFQIRGKGCPRPAATHCSRRSKEVRGM